MFFHFQLPVLIPLTPKSVGIAVAEFPVLLPLTTEIIAIFRHQYVPVALFAEGADDFRSAVAVGFGDDLFQHRTSPATRCNQDPCQADNPESGFPLFFHEPNLYFFIP